MTVINAKPGWAWAGRPGVCSWGHHQEEDQEGQDRVPGQVERLESQVLHLGTGGEYPWSTTNPAICHQGRQHNNQDYI